MQARSPIHRCLQTFAGCVGVALFLLVPILPTPVAQACSCEEPDVEEMLARSSGAVVATFVGRGEDGGEDNFNFDSTEYRFEVEEWVKGTGGQRLSVWSSPDGAACGLEVPLGQTAGLFLSLRNGKAMGDLCSTVGAGALQAMAVVPGGENFDGAVTSRPASLPGVAVETQRSGPLLVLAVAVVLVVGLGVGLALVLRTEKSDRST